MSFSDLVETLNGGGGVFAVCALLSGVVLTAALLLLLMGSRRRAASPPIDDDVLRRRAKTNASKKTKQSKATTKESLENADHSSSTKVSSKQSPVKRTSKEKQADEKTKSAQKKGTVVASVSTCQVQQIPESSGDWTVAGSKKKQKSKKTDASAKNMEAKTTSVMHVVKDSKIADSEETALSGETMHSDKANGSSVTEDQVSVVFKKKSCGNESNVLSDQFVNGGRQPASSLSSLPVGSDDGFLETIESNEKESKLKTASKKKKSKLTTEITLNVVPNSHAEDKATRNSMISKVNPQINNAKLLLNDASAAPQTSRDMLKDEVVNYEAVTTPRDLAKDKSDDLLVAVSNVPSKNDTPTASTAGSENKTPNKKISEAVSSSILDTCEEVIFGKDVAKNVVSSSVNDVASKIVFDELGIKDEAQNSSQPALKKKKKARKDV